MVPIRNPIGVVCAPWYVCILLLTMQCCCAATQNEGLQQQGSTSLEYNHQRIDAATSIRKLSASGSSGVTSVAGLSNVRVHNTQEFLEALSKPTTSVVIIAQDIKLSETAWPSDRIVEIRGRNVTISGPPELSDLPMYWPLLDTNMLTRRIKITTGVHFKIQMIWIFRLRMAVFHVYAGKVLTAAGAGVHCDNNKLPVSCIIAV